MSIKEEISQKVCHLCQSHGDHKTANCPKLVCAECDEKGHAKKHCPYLVDSRDNQAENGIEINHDQVRNIKSETLDMLENELSEVKQQFDFGQRMLHNLRSMLTFPEFIVNQEQNFRIQSQINLRIQSLACLTIRMDTLRRQISAVQREPESQHNFSQKREETLENSKNCRRNQNQASLLDLQQRLAGLITWRAQIQNNPAALEQNCMFILELEQELCTRILTER